jgi:hypothetical protein
MPEAISNVEFAHKIHEDGHHHPTPTGCREQWVEIIEAAVLAIVAIATAWSGYQASKWDARSNEYYNLASSARVVSQEKATLAGPGPALRHHDFQRLGCGEGERQRQAGRILQAPLPSRIRRRLRSLVET